MLRAEILPHNLIFKETAVTSRETMDSKLTYILSVWDESCHEIVGKGEIALFKGLSKEDKPDFPALLRAAVENINNTEFFKNVEASSIRFGYECALADLNNGGRGVLFPSPFTDGGKPIRINGLIWMGDKETMNTHIKKKLEEGFSCLKLKIGGINFDDELELLRVIRQEFSHDVLELRLDANCSFAGYSFEEALDKIECLSRFGIHSIEQPFSVGDWEKTTSLIAKSIIPVALDEELIGVTELSDKCRLLQQVRPQYIILKPSLCGGIQQGQEWIELAEANGVGWWITSALESAIGLNAICQWAGSLNVTMPQGLGTGELYVNDFTSHVKRDGELLYFNKCSGL